MSRSTNLQDHMSVEELGNRYRRARNLVERSHAQFAWLIARGQSAKEATQTTS
jgi:hypothetical protein